MTLQRDTRIVDEVIAKAGGVRSKTTIKTIVALVKRLESRPNDSDCVEAIEVIVQRS